MMTRKSSAEKTVRDIRRATRKRYSYEEKIRIVLEGLRGEESVAELCQGKHDIHSARASITTTCAAAAQPSQQLRGVLASHRPSAHPAPSAARAPPRRPGKEQAAGVKIIKE